MAIFDRPQCMKCGFPGQEPNEWCFNHPVYMVSGASGYIIGPGPDFDSDTVLGPPVSRTSRLASEQQKYLDTILGVVPPRDDRPTWDDVWMGLADNISRRSKCTRAQVGAVIVDKHQNVISAAYNGPPKDFDADGPCTSWCPRSRAESEPSPTYDDCPSAHAEANAIARADFSRLEDGTIYISTSPCKGCAKIFSNCGIARVVYRDEQGRDYRSPQATRDFLEQCSMDVHIYKDPNASAQ